MFSLVLASALSPCLPHFPFLCLHGCQEKEFSKQFPTPAVWYCCEVSTGSLAAILHRLQCCICSSAESKLLTHLFFSYLSFTGAKAGISPSICPQSYVNFQYFLWNEQGEESQEKFRFPNRFGFKTDSPVNILQWEGGDRDTDCWDHLSISQQECSALLTYCIFSCHKAQSK